MLRDAADDITAFADFPVPHWKKIGSTAALLRLAGSVLVEADDEWQVADKRYLSESTLALLNEPND